MSRLVWLVLAAVGLVTLRTNGQSPEQARLRLHFDSVLVELRTADVSALSSKQRVFRKRLIDWLGEYRDAGAFPLNDGYSSGPTPIFRDARGVTCAMAYLIERSGRVDIVDRIAETSNLAYIPDLTGDTSLVAWLESSGLSVAEAARIQPAYEREDPGTRVAMVAGTVVLSTMSLATARSNAFQPSEGMGFVGIAVGSVTLLLAGAVSQDHAALATVNVVSGGLAVLTGVYAAFRPRPAPSASSESFKSRRAEWSPFASIDPKLRRTRAGISGRF